MQKKISVGSLIWSLTCFSLSFRGIALAESEPPKPAKVATIVILNNTGLPDDKIYVNLSNTATPDGATFCPGVDMTTLFQWYGGYGSSTGGLGATQITNTMVPPGNANGNQYYSIKLSDMRGWVLSNATSSSLTPTESDPWWAQQNYASLGVSNYPAADAPTTGLFPTISLGLFGACETGKTQFAGRIAISAYAAFTGDTFSSSQSPAPPPYVLFEGSIFPTDAKETQFSDGTTKKYTSGQASNFDISYVDQIGIAADMELWGPTLTSGSEYVKLPLGNYATGGPLVTAPDTIALVNGLVTTAHLQTIGYPVSSTQTVYNYYSFKSDLGGGSYPNPFGPFLDQLVKDTWDQEQQAPPHTHPVLRVGSWGKQTFVGGVKSNLAFNNDPFYGNATGYQFAGYLGYFAGGNTSCSDPFWEQILQWLPDDMPAAASFVPGTTPHSPCFLDPGAYLLLVGGFPPSSETQDSINPGGRSASGDYTVAMAQFSGPLSVQLEGFDPTAAQPASTVQACAYYSTVTPPSTTPCTLTVSTQPASIQSVGVPPGPTSTTAFFDWNVDSTPPAGGMQSESGGIGLNFFNQSPQEMALGTVKLAAGLTANVADGTLRITLKSIASTTDAGTDLARVTLTIPSGTSYQGGEANAVATNLGRPALGWTDWPLTVDWVSQTCTMTGATLTDVTWEYYNNSSWNSGAPQNGAPNPNFIAACAIANLTQAGTGYQVFLEGDNMSVATTKDVPLGQPQSGSIVAGLFGDAAQIYGGSSGRSCQRLSGLTNDYLACSISLAPPKSTASESLHLLAIPMSSLKSPTGIAGNNPPYRFFRFNANTPAWEESVCAEQICAPVTGEQYQPWPTGTSLTPNGPSTDVNSPTPLACAIVNDLSGRIAGDAVAAFSYGMVSSTKTGNDFPNASWPTAANYPPRSTAIGDLTTGQYFTLGAAQLTNDGTLPIGSNLWPGSPSLTAYDPYVDIGINKAQSNEYFSGFGDRLQGGFMTPAFTWAMDEVPSGKDFATLGYEPGSPSGTKTVIVIRLHSLSTSTQPSNNCPWDLDQNGVVNAADVSLLLLDFGPCSGNPCQGDFDGSGDVDSGDISIMLLQWGACPSGFMDGLQADRPTPMIGEELDAAPVRMGPLTRSR